MRRAAPDAYWLDSGGYLQVVSAAVLLLKRSKDQATAGLAWPFLKTVETLSAAGSISEHQKKEFGLTVGIFYVLVDQPSIAREYFEKVLKADKENETARQAMAMLAGK